MTKISTPSQNGDIVRPLPLILTVVLLSVGAVNGDDRFRRGDSNGDGTVDVSDGTRILLALFDQVAASPCTDASDADDSGALDLADAVFTFAFLFTGGAVPPAPGILQCGDDATPDELDCEEYLPCSLPESRSVGPEGGRLEFSSGIVLDVPGGAVNGATTITLGGLPGGLDQVFGTTPLAPKELLGGFAAEPDGLEFATPITASIPIAPLPPGAIPVAMGADLEEGVSWLEPTEITYYPEESRIETTVRHFSNTYVGYLPRGFGFIVAEGSEIPPDDKCRVGVIRVVSQFIDFESASKTESCAAVSDNVEVTYVSCPGSPTERVVASSIHGEMCDITVEILPRSPKVVVGCSVDLFAIVRIESQGAEDAEVRVPVLWTSSDPGVASVDPLGGRAVARGPGSTEISATTADPRFADTITLTVGPLEIEPRYEVAVGDQVLVGPPAACPGLRWESSDPGVASAIDGFVIGESRGTATIRVFSDGGDCDQQPCASTVVEVFPNVNGLWEFEENLDITIGEMGEGGSGFCRITGRLCVIQEGAMARGFFEEFGVCTIFAEGVNEPILEVIDEVGELSGSVTQSGYTYKTVADDSDEECEHSGSIGTDRPMILTGSVDCLLQNADVFAVTTGSGTATLTDPESACPP